MVNNNVGERRRKYQYISNEVNRTGAYPEISGLDPHKIESNREAYRSGMMPTTKYQTKEEYESGQTLNNPIDLTSNTTSNTTSVTNGGRRRRTQRRISNKKHRKSTRKNNRKTKSRRR